MILAKPQTMMNLSGVAVRMLLERYECEPAETIVLLDEVDLPWGMLRIRDRGRNSTHNGLKSIIATLGTDEFIRVRMGVRPEKIWGDRKDYLLCTMGRDERQIAAADGRGRGRRGRGDPDRGLEQGDDALQPQGFERGRREAVEDGESRGHMEERLYDLIFICGRIRPRRKSTK